MEVWLPETQSDHGIFSSKKDNSKFASTDDDDDDDKAITVAHFDDDDDKAITVARMIQQEFDDAEYAHRIQIQIRTHELEEAASRQYVLSLEWQQQQLQQGKRQRQRQRRVRVRVAIWAIIAVTIVATILLVTATLLFVFGVFGNTSDDDENFRDGWTGGNANVTVVTRNDGTTIAIPRPGPDALGWVTENTTLKLDILNACDDSWQPTVEKAIANWGNGSPIDSLTLNVRAVDYEFECAAVGGKVKICNG